jgi:hypothetical protein
LAALAALLSGCAGPARHQPGATVARGPVPTYEEVAAAYNRRVEPLDRLWARTVIRVWFVNQEGKEQQEQLEGHLQYLRPDRLLLTFDKVGTTYAALGSNDQKYWWIETRGDRKAWVGQHEEATPELIAQLGLPVHPLEFVELLGITPLPVRAPGARVEWSEDGRLRVTAPGRMGERRLWLDPQRWVPLRVDVLGTGGEVVISAELTRYQAVAVRSPIGHWNPEVPGELQAQQDRAKLRVRMTLFDPETAGARPKASAFDLERLLKLLEVDQVQQLHPEAAPAPAAAAR